MEFPRHDVSLTLTHNDHKSVHETVEDWARHATDADGGWCEWVSDEQREKAIAANDVWTLQWYPDTSVGFFAMAAADLDVLLAAAREVEQPATHENGPAS